MLERGLIAEERFGYMPDSWDDILRTSYSVGLKISIMQAEKNKPIGEYNRKRLQELDSVLSLIEKNFDNKHFGYAIELHMGDKGPPSRFDIRKIFGNIMDEDVCKENFRDNNLYMSKWFSVGYNILKNYRRVINRVLKGEPLYLISNDVESFKKFADKLSSSPEETKFPYS